MTKAQYEVFEALNPFFGVVLKGLRGLVDGKHYLTPSPKMHSSNLAINFPAGPSAREIEFVARKLGSRDLCGA